MYTRTALLVVIALAGAARALECEIDGSGETISIDVGIPGRNAAALPPIQQIAAGHGASSIPEPVFTTGSVSGRRLFSLA